MDSGFGTIEGTKVYLKQFREVVNYMALTTEREWTLTSTEGKLVPSFRILLRSSRLEN